MTFAEFEMLPDIDRKQELVDGELIVPPPGEIRHAKITKKAFDLLTKGMDYSHVWTHAGYRIGDGWIQPDVSIGWPDQKEDDKYFVGSPMIAVEILSTGEEIERKLTLYFAEGALEVWLIDPRHKTMTVYVRQNGEVVRRVVDREYRCEAAQSTVSLAEIFE